MNRRDVLKGLIAIPLLASTVPAEASTTLVQLASGQDLRVLVPPSGDAIGEGMRQRDGLQITGVYGAMLETNVGPIALKTKHFYPIQMRHGDSIELIWTIALDPKTCSYNQDLRECLVS